MADWIVTGVKPGGQGGSAGSVWTGTDEALAKEAARGLQARGMTVVASCDRAPVSVAEWLARPASAGEGVARAQIDAYRESVGPIDVQQAVEHGVVVIENEPRWWEVRRRLTNWRMRRRVERSTHFPVE